MPTSPLPDGPVSGWNHGDVLANGVRLHFVRRGEGPPVVLLHGFPEFWYSWRYQIVALAAAGYAVFAPDLRGYNTSEKVPGVAAYDIDVLVADVVAFVDRCCGGKAFLVGHDWGGIVAWYAAIQHPERFTRLAILNAPHPGPFGRDLFTTDQWIRSLYVLFFQLRGLSEAALRFRNCWLIERVFATEVFNEDAFAHGEVAHYKEAMTRPGALTAALSYYRAAVRRRRRLGTTDPRPIAIPTLVLWGDRDPHLRAGLADGLERWVTDVTVRHFPASGHWIQLDEPDLVSRSLAEFFASTEAS
jgi:epoxide hydrolase 4